MPAGIRTHDRGATGGAAPSRSRARARSPTGTLLRIARLSARLHRPDAPGRASGDRLPEVVLCAHHCLESEGRGELSPGYLVDHGLSAVDEMHTLLCRGDVAGLGSRADEMLGLAAVAADALAP